MKSYPTPADKEVTSPNADIYYTLAWLDLSKEPMVLVKPDFGDRYYLLPMLSGWTDVFNVPGSRTEGGAAKNYLITGPGWARQVPEGMEELKTPTSTTWTIGRIYCTGTQEDAEKVHALSAVDYFKLLARLLKANPPALADSVMVTKLAKLGIVAGEELDVSKLDTTVVAAINSVAKPAQEKIIGALPEFGKMENNCSFIPSTGQYETRTSSGRW